MLKKIFRTLGSLQFAIALLVVLIVAIIFGTIFESRISADVAQKYVYGAWWFNFWLGALAVNLFCVAADRYPWKRHQTGFVITHAGIITLLIGSVIDRMYGIEGQLQLHSNRPATNVMELLSQVFRVKIDGKDAETPFKLATLSEMNARSPDPDVKVRIVDVQPIIEIISATKAKASDPDARPGLNFTLEGPMMGRHDKCIFLNQRDAKSLGGMAEVIFVPGMPPVAEDHKTDSRAELILRFQGKSFKFLVKQGEEKDIALDGLPDWKIHLIGYYPNFKMDKVPISVDDNPDNPVVVFDLIGPEVHGVALKEADPHGIAVKQDPDKIAPRTERFFVFYKEDQIMNAVRHGEPTGADAQIVLNTPRSSLKNPNGLAFYLGSDNKLRYVLRSRNKSHTDSSTPAYFETHGEVELEKPVAVSWAPGAQFVVHEFLESAVYKSEILPNPVKKDKMDGALLGLDCRVTSGGETKQAWIYQTGWDNITPQEIEINGKHINFEFTNQTYTLPFYVGLKKFSAPQDEGSNEVSAFESIISFDGSKDTVWLKPNSEMAKELGTNQISGAVLEENDTAVKMRTDSGDEGFIERKDIEHIDIKTQHISMNRPTTFPYTWYGPFTGWNYKFSQANHHLDFQNPENSDFTFSGVQVLRDPGWMPKWIGCIMICFGIFTMFYLRPYFNRRPEPAKETAAKDTAAKEIEAVVDAAMEKGAGKKNKKARALAEAATRS